MNQHFSESFDLCMICFCVYKYLCAWCRCCGELRHHHSIEIQPKYRPGCVAFIYEQISVIGFSVIYVYAIDFMRYLQTGASSWTLTSRLWTNSVWWGVGLMGPLFKIDLHNICICGICLIIASIFVHMFDFPLIAQVSISAIWPSRSILDLCLALIWFRFGWSWVCCCSCMACWFCHTVWAPCCGFKICSSMPESEAMRLWQVKQGAVPMPCSCLVNRAHMLRCNMAALVAAIWALGGHMYRLKCVDKQTYLAMFPHNITYINKMNRERERYICII